MKITIDRGDHEVTYRTTAQGCHPLVIGTTTRRGMRVKCLDRPNLGWMFARYVSIEPEDRDALRGHGPLNALVHVTRGKHGKYPKARPTSVFENGSLLVGIHHDEINRIQRLCDEIDRFAELMKSRKGLRTVAVAKMRQKAERKRQKRERLAIDAFIRRYGPVGWSLLNRMYEAAGCC